MRPRALDEVLGQDDLLGPGKLLTQALTSDRLPSLILWGPPGCGKTTLARLTAHHVKRRFVALSAVFSGVREVRAVVDQALAERQSGADSGAILFVDEIHRFNKSQQDAFLPYVESGLITLVGATTENPSFELNGALLSRCRVLVLKPLASEHLLDLLRRALRDPERGYGAISPRVDDEALRRLADEADGDARYALNLLESLVELNREALDRGEVLGLAALESGGQRRALLYDRAGEEHYNLISALHKSLRGSDADAALYWLARMLAGGEDGLYVARRMVRFASEDVGNADPQALTIALAARDAYHFLGAPEGELALAQAAVYLACAPKSNSVYVAYGKAKAAAEKQGSLPPPLHIRNAPTRLMKDLGYGDGYRYAHDYEHGYAAQEYLPEALRHERFYEPVERGFERELAKRLAFWRGLKKPEKP
ncbi:MAG: replication-associated recombination protein A [Magnetococcales bacterium]|nr:replication-associated recombination protein A [Magnetococcales bacterium]